MPDITWARLYSGQRRDPYGIPPFGEKLSSLNNKEETKMLRYEWLFILLSIAAALIALYFDSKRDRD